MHVITAGCLSCHGQVMVEICCSANGHGSMFHDTREPAGSARPARPGLLRLAAGLLHHPGHGHVRHHLRQMHALCRLRLLRVLRGLPARERAGLHVLAAGTPASAPVPYPSTSICDGTVLAFGQPTALPDSNAQPTCTDVVHEPMDKWMPTALRHHHLKGAGSRAILELFACCAPQYQ